MTIEDDFKNKIEDVKEFYEKFKTAFEEIKKIEKKIKGSSNIEKKPMISFRLKNYEEKQELIDMARNAGKTVSDYLRTLIFDKESNDQIINPKPEKMQNNRFDELIKFLKFYDDFFKEHIGHLMKSKEISNFLMTEEVEKITSKIEEILKDAESS